LNELKIENLCFHTIGPVNLIVSGSECIGITGPSGAGKSLFLRSVADMDPHTGSIFLDGVESFQIPAPLWRKQVGLFPAESRWWFDTVGEHFHHSSSREWREDGRMWLEELGFDIHVMKWNISRLSSGERQRLALLRLLVNQPKVLLLDEPTANLDAENIMRVEKIIDDYRVEKKPAIIWVGHDIQQLKRASNFCFILKNNDFRKLSL